MKIFSVFALFGLISMVAVLTPSYGFAKQVDSIIPLEILAKRNTYLDAELSPDGTKLAVRVVKDERRTAIILDVDTFEMINTFSSPEGMDVGNLTWLNNERILAEVLRVDEDFAQPQFRGELFAFNYDGSKARMIFGYSLQERGSGRAKSNEATFGFANVIDILEDDPRHILVTVSKWNERNRARPRPQTIHKLNVYTGKLFNEYDTAPTNFTRFVTDSKMQARVAAGQNRENNQEVFIKDLEEDEWVQLPPESFGKTVIPLTLDEAEENLYFLDNVDNTLALYTLELTSKKRELVYQEEHIDISNLVFSSDGTEVYAIAIDDGYRQYAMLPTESKEAQLYRELLQTFAGNDIAITSVNKDVTKAVVLVYSDVNMGTYYLYDQQNKKLRALFSEHPNEIIDKMSPTQPINFTARDGEEIPGYITYPASVDEDIAVPLVALIHGGPHGIRDTWFYDSEVQMLAAQGYAVLQVNMRGSGGYGVEFLEAGYQKWGSLMQYDLIDGIKALASQKRIDENRICTMGGSYGGYSAVMAATIEPDLISCVVANVGVYDLEIMFTEGDVPDSYTGGAFLETILGTDEDKLKAYSPTNHVDKLKAPLLIAHGKKDVRAPFKHAEHLMAAMDKHDKPYETFFKEDEAHGFYAEESRLEYFETVAKFLATHLQ